LSTMNNSPGQAITENTWQKIHAAVQVILASWAERVQTDYPSIHSRGGKTQTDRFPLFSYRAFEVPAEPDLDPVVAGLDFTLSDSGRSIVVRADLCGEESGRIWFELPEQTLPPIEESLEATAGSLARKLSERGDLLVAALNQQKIGSSR
jgi:hypothetical protein